MIAVAAQQSLLRPDNRQLPGKNGNRRKVQVVPQRTSRSKVSSLALSPKPIQTEALMLQDCLYAAAPLKPSSRFNQADSASVSLLGTIVSSINDSDVANADWEARHSFKW